MDKYILLQVNSDRADRVMFESLETLGKMGLKPDPKNYDLVYQGRCTWDLPDVPKVLELIYERFNVCQPEDYHGRSLSVSDIVGLQKNGKTWFYYVQPFGYKELTDFHWETEEVSEEEQTFYVTFKVEGRYVAEVHAPSLEKARKTAVLKWQDADFGELSDIDGEDIIVEDQNGNYVWER